MALSDVAQALPPDAADPGTGRLPVGLTGPIAGAVTLMTQSRRFTVAGEPLAALPWFLVFGDGADSRALLAAAAHGSPFPPPQRRTDDTAGWHWWFTEELAAVELAPALFCPAGDRPAWALLEAALGLLVTHRRALPLNGMVLVVNAAAVARRPADLGDLGGRLRRIADEAARTIGLRFPVYVVVTGLDLLPGHAALFAALPSEAGDQAIGHRFDPDRPGAATAELTAFLAGFRERLRRLRLSLLVHGRDSGPAAGIFRFPEEFAGLRPGLGALVEALTGADATLQPARLRAVFFTAPGAAAAHVTDVFKRFLPADAPLARRD